MEKIIQSTLQFANSNLFEKLVMRIFDNFKKGTLHLTLPSGETKTIGETNEIVADIKVNNQSFFQKIVLSGDIGLGESYSDGDWETSDLTNVIKWAILNVETSGMMSGSEKKAVGVNLLSLANKAGHLFKRNSFDGSKKNISFHYDLSNQFYKLMLDPTMLYSCAIFDNKETTLEQAQYNKLKKLAEDLDIQKGDHILEIGCGWGAFAEFVTKNYDCRITGVTISEQQYIYACDRLQKAGLQGRATILLQDYRKLEGQFDKIVSIEMIEAVGHEFLPVFFGQCEKLLKPEGLLVIQAITSPDSRYDSFRKGVDWIQKHIFPGSLLPSVGALNQAALEASDFHLYHLRDIGLHYAHTLRLWRENVEAHLNEIKALNFDEEFLRKWRYYLSYCEAAFAMRNISDVQLTYTRPNNRGPHQLGWE